MKGTSDVLNWIRKKSSHFPVSTFEMDRSYTSRSYIHGKSIFNSVYPIGIYIFFLFSVVLDFGSTIFALNLGSQYRWIEANPLFYTLGSVPFFSIYIFINVFLFVLVLHHQTQWRRGAIFLLPSIVVHGSYGLNNMIQLLTL